MKHGIQSQKVVAEVIKQKPTVRWLFLTLTVKNVYDGEELNKSLSDMAQGFLFFMILLKYFWVSPFDFYVRIKIVRGDEYSWLNPSKNYYLKKKK